MKRLPPLKLLLLMALPVGEAGAIEELSWLRKFGTWVSGGPPPTFQACRDGSADSKGALIMVGGISAPGFSMTLDQFLALKYDRAGTLAWARQSPGEGGAGAQAVATDSADNVFLTGGPTLKYDTAGNLIWKTVSPGKTVDIAVDSAGDVYVCGSLSGVTGLDFLVVKYNAAGSEVWTRRYDGASKDDAAVALVAVPGGGVAVTGYITETVGGRKFMTVKYDGAGSAEWVRFHDISAGQDDSPVGLVATPSGDVIVAGTAAGKVVTVRYSAAGNERWVSSYEQAGNFSAKCTGIALNSGGTVGVVCNWPIYVPPSPPSIKGTTYVDSVILRVDQSGVGTPILLERRNAQFANPTFSSRVAGSPNGFIVSQWITEFASPRGHEIFRINNEGNTEKILTGLNLSLQNQYAAGFLAVDSEGGILEGGFFRQVPQISPNDELYALRIGEPQVAIPPSALTGNATNLTWQNVSLSGTVNPKGKETSWYFQYGETTAYGLRTQDQAAGAGTGEIPTVAPAIPVSPGTTYHFRIVAASLAGTSMGLDQTFTVPNSPHQLWRIQQFGSLQAEGSAPGEDPDGDGDKNLLEYAFGSNPRDAANRPSPLQPYRFTNSASGFTYLAVDYPVNSLLEDLAWIPEASSDLVS